MSSLQSPPKARSKSTVEYVEYDKYIDRQVERTRRAVKLIDLAQAVLVLVIGLAAFLLTAALLEHWVVRGGLGTLGRLALFGVLVVLLGFYLVRYLWPLLSQSISPAYAAHAIEREHPTLKNSLLNFLLFRSHKREMPAAVFDALQEQAAHRLSQTSLDDSIDRSALVKLGYVLLAVVAAFALYASLSPKSSLTTAARVLMPWADIAAPSRVRIENIEPGDIQLVQGETVDISAQVFGLREGEVVELSFDTADGHRVDDRIVMQPANDAGKYIATLPDTGDPYSPAGIDQDLRYRVTAGDGRSIDYDIRVVTAPTIRVQQIQFDFPEYTGYVDRTVENRGDIRAIEGTKVTIVGQANTDIAEAYIDLDSDGRNDKRMQVEGSRASATLPLRLEGSRQSIKSTSYMLRYTSVDGLDNNDPPQHTIEILPDYPPEVELLEPEERSVDVRLNETVAIEIDARDPDFALRDVTLKLAKQDGTAVHDEMLLDKRHKGRFAESWDFTPADYDLQPGEIVECWAEATDVRTPQANRTASERKQFRIVGDPNDRGQGEGSQGQGEQGEGNNGEGEQAEGEQGEGGQGEGDGQQGEGDQGQGNQGEGDEDGEGADGAEGTEGGQGDQGSEQQQGDQGGAEGQQGAQQQGGGQGNQEQENAGGEAGQNSEGQEAQEGQNGTGGDSQQPRDGQQRDGQAGEGGQARDNPDGAAGENTRPVANDGSDDASAFEKIQRQLSEEERENATRERRPGTADQGEAGADQTGEQSEDESGDGQDAQPSQDAASDGGQREASRSGSDQSSSDDREPSESPDGQQGEAQDRSADGAGADTQNDTPQSAGGEENDTSPDAQSESTGGEQRDAAGEPGAGDDTKPEGSPDAQREQQQRDKTSQQQEGEAEQEGGEPPTPGHSKQESDSQGEQGGDRSGGGEEGGGQQAPREGTGSAGQNQAADEGAGQSADQGPGETGERGGDSQESEGQTGESGDQQGNGTQSRQGEGDTGQQGEGQQSQQQSDQQQSQNQNQNSQQQSEQGRQQDSQQPSDQQQQGDPQGGNDSASRSGQPGGNDGAASGGPEGDFDGTLAEGDDANLEYTRKQTDLVLDKLSDQLDNGEVDQDMLDELGWSEDDLRQFVSRWNKLRQNAQQQGDPAAQQELDERLRSLGPSLGPQSGTTQRTQDDFRDLREGYQNKVPLKYRDRLKAYTEGVSRSGDSGEE